MILINKNQPNICYFTLREKATLANPFYLFKIKSLQTNEEVIFTGLNISDNEQRFDKFIITETSGTTNYTASTVSLTTGSWFYNVYEMSGQTNLDISGTTGNVVEKGFFLVSGDSQSSTTYTGGDNDEVVVYFQ